MLARRVGNAIDAQAMSKERVAAAAGQSLAVQGYCVIEGFADSAALEAAAREAAALAAEGRLEQPPAMLVDGLLGAQGSARIRELWPSGDGDDGAEWHTGEGLSHLDAEMNALSEALAPELSEAGIDVHSRTGGVVHEAGMPLDEDPSLNGEACSKWLNIFANHTLMMVWNLGPGRGTLELEPFDDDCNSKEIHLQPGWLLVLRADAMLHRFVAATTAYCLTCFCLQEPSSRKGGDDGVTPCCQMLEAWAFERMCEYKECLPEERADLGLPRRWELMASHQNFVGQHVAVRSAGIKEPSSYDVMAWASAFCIAPDYVSEVPTSRWDHAGVFQDDDGATLKQWKSTCNHGAFIEGVELFDNATFRLSRVEAGGMDPGHRSTLETGYEALVRDGYTTSKLMNSRGGVYVANPPPEEWGDAEKMGSPGIFMGGSIACGRFSFIFGMKGPCISVDVEAASSLVAVSLAGTNLSRIGNWEPIPFAVCSSWNLQLNPRPYIFGSVRGVLCPAGRTFALDGSAAGYVRGDCAISLVLKAMAEEVDGAVVVKDNNFLGALAASATNQSGRRAHMTAPDTVALQEVIAECLRQADVSPLDVDACDIFANGMIMGDAVEVSATTRAYRPDGALKRDSASTLTLLASKTAHGNQLEACGLSSILKVVLGAQFGSTPPNVHTRILNPYIDMLLCERPGLASNELLSYSIDSSYTGIANMSCSGTNCHVIVWGHRTPEAEWAGGAEHAGSTEEERRWAKIRFWPEGGGDLEDDQMPKRGYSLVGTFNGWAPQTMEQESGGTWGFTITLSVNRWERFQIALDGDKARVLHPEYAGAGCGALVCGPDAVLRRESWLLDARTEALTKAAGTSADAIESRPGEQYRIRLRVSGKWRTVEWERLSTAKIDDVDLGDYHVVGTWNDLEPQAMLRDAEVPNSYSAEVHFASSGVFYFQLLRNRDWCQVLCPVEPVVADPAAGGGAVAPDENWGHFWLLNAEAGDVFRIKLRRSADEAAERTSVTWTRVRHETPSREALLMASMPRFYIAGTWDGFRNPIRMNIAEGHLQAFIELGSSKTESFQIYRNADWRECIYPSSRDATPGDGHTVEGPDITRGSGRQWTLGLAGNDAPAPGKWYEIRLRVDLVSGRPLRLDWSAPLRSMEGLEDASGRGYLIVCP